MFEIEKVLEFENNKELYSFTIQNTQTPIWPIIRFNALKYMRNDRMFDRKEPMKRYEHKYVEQELTIRNPYLSKEKDILYMFFRNEKMSKHEDGSVYEDQYYNFIDLFRNSSTVLMNYSSEDLFDFRCDYPEWKSCYSINQEIQNGMLNKVDGQEIREFIQYLKRNLPYELDREKYRLLQKEAFSIHQKYASVKAAYEKYIQKVKPKIVILYCAHYIDIGRAAVMQVCHEKGITTAEIQHASYGKSVFAYIYSEYYHNEICRQLIPDYVLTRGQYWNNCIKTPAKRYVIGTSYLDCVAKRPNNRNILCLVSDDFEAFYKLMEYVLLFDNDWVFYFRLHPGFNNKAYIERGKSLLKYKNFRLANDRSYTDYMSECAYVITEGSTCFFEALALGRMVFALNNSVFQNYGSYDFEDVHIFKEPEEFMRLWDEHKDDVAKVHSEIFELNWKEKYTEFLKMVGAVK